MLIIALQSGSEKIASIASVSAGRTRVAVSLVLSTLCGAAFRRYDWSMMEGKSDRRWMRGAALLASAAIIFYRRRLPMPEDAAADAVTAASRDPMGE